MALELRSRRSPTRSAAGRPRRLWSVALVLIASSAVSRGDEVVLEGRTMGTTWTIRVPGIPGSPAGTPPAGPGPLREAVQQELDRLEGIFSLYRADSEISRWNDQSTTGWIDVSEDLAHVALSALDVAARTGGAFDPTVEPLGRVWGIRDVAPASPPARPPSRSDFPQIGFQLVEASLAPPRLRKSNPATRLDLNALVEGYAIDRLIARLRSRGVDSALVGLGGEFRGLGRAAPGTPWRIAIESPQDPLAVLASVSLGNGALSTSGTYRQERRQADGTVASHIFDGRTLSPVGHDTVSVTVVADTALDADRWSTALLALGAGEGRALADAEALEALFVRRSSPRPEFSTRGRSRIRLLDSPPPEGAPPPRFSWGAVYVAVLSSLIVFSALARGPARRKGNGP